MIKVNLASIVNYTVKAYKAFDKSGVKKVVKKNAKTLVTLIVGGGIGSALTAHKKNKESQVKNQFYKEALKKLSAKVRSLEEQRNSRQMGLKDQQKV